MNEELTIVEYASIPEGEMPGWQEAGEGHRVLYLSQNLETGRFDIVKPTEEGDGLYHSTAGSVVCSFQYSLNGIIAPRAVAYKNALTFVYAHKDSALLKKVAEAEKDFAELCRPMARYPVPEPIKLWLVSNLIFISGAMIGHTSQMAKLLGFKVDPVPMAPEPGPAVFCVDNGNGLALYVYAKNPEHAKELSRFDKVHNISLTDLKPGTKLGFERY